MAKYRVICKHSENSDEYAIFGANWREFDFIDFDENGNEVYEMQTDAPSATEHFMDEQPAIISYERIETRGGARPGAGAPRQHESPEYEQGYQAGYKAAGRDKDAVRVIKLVKSAEQLYGRYHGDTDMAVVKDGKCVAGWVNGQTGAAVLTRDDRSWDWVGLSVEGLKANGFTYKRTDTTYHGAKSGKEYHQMDDGSWERADEEGWTPVSGEVQIIEQ